MKKGVEVKAKKKSFEFDAAGWLFWGALFALLVAPAVYGSWKITYRTASTLIPIGMGIVTAAIGAGLVSWAVNALLDRKNRRRRLSEKKKARKRK